MADCVSESKKFVLIANPSERIVDGIVPIREEVIPMRSFFDIVEMFADKHGYEVDQLQSYGNIVYGVTARLMPVHPQYSDINMYVRTVQQIDGFCLAYSALGTE